MNTLIVTTIVNSPIGKVWQYWNEPEHITKWAFASSDWEAPYAENDLREDGKFLTRMAAKDGSAMFDFVGTYTAVVPEQKIAYTIADGRTVEVSFEKVDDRTTKITETFEPEHENPEEMQKSGWQSILNNFKKYVETN